MRTPNRLSLSLLLAAGLTGCLDVAPTEVPLAETHAELTAATGTRPLVALMMALPGPTAPAGAQWATTAQPVARAIPDNFTSGVNGDVTIGTVGGACNQMKSIVARVGVTHARIADLFVTVSALSSTGTVLKTVTVFDGPTLGRAGTSPADMMAALGGDLDVSLLTQASTCGRLRVNVADFAAGSTGTLDAVTVKVRTAWFPYAHDRAYYTGQLFGPGFPNIADYFREASRGTFTVANAGVYGPVPWGNWHVGETDTEHVVDIIAWLDALGFNFAAYDTNHDGTVTADELLIVQYENTNDVGGANRGACSYAPRAGVQVCERVAIVSQQTDFATLAHELSHSLGTADLYGAWSKECWSNALTLMSCTISGADNPAIYYLDPWHRSKLGWYAPAPTACTASRLGDETWTDPASGLRSRPARYTNPKNPNEYFLIEYRGKTGYDRDANDKGVVAWHVSENADGSAYKGADGKQPEGHAVYAVSPSFPGGPLPGGSQAWNPGNGDFKLKWLDGTALPYTFSVAPSTTNSAVLNCYDPARFNFSINPTVTSLAANDTESLTITSTMGSCSPIQYAVTAAPPGVYAAVSGPSVSTSGTSYLYLGVDLGTAPSSGAVTVTGSCGGQTHAVSVQMQTTACVPAPMVCGTATCGTLSDNCGHTLTCGTCGSGLTCQAGTCAAPPPRCTTPRACCLQAGGYWINNHCE